MFNLNEATYQSTPVFPSLSFFSFPLYSPAWFFCGQSVWNPDLNDLMAQTDTVGTAGPLLPRFTASSSWLLPSDCWTLLAVRMVDEPPGLSTALSAGGVFAVRWRRISVLSKATNLLFTCCYDSKCKKRSQIPAWSSRLHAWALLVMHYKSSSLLIAQHIWGSGCTIHLYFHAYNLQQKQYGLKNGL